jgi:pyrimidine operon attenuation protein/uracil phosphoribosyltransferase
VVTIAADSSAESVGLGALVDLAHAASMVGLALVDRGVRRLTLSDALVATTFATAGLSQVTQGPADDD